MPIVTRSLGWIFAIALCFCCAATPALADTPIKVELIDLAGVFAGQPNVSISGDGRNIAFRGSAPAPYTYAVFVHDRVTGQQQLVSVNSAGEPANGRSECAAISGNGRYVAFGSNAPNLGLVGLRAGYFVRDLVNQTTELVATHAGTDPSLYISFTLCPAISSDGRYIAYRTGDNSVAGGIAVRDMVTKTTYFTKPPSGNYSTDDRMSISDDGRYVEYAGKPVGGADGSENIMVLDRVTGLSTMQNVNTAGVRATQTAPVPPRVRRGSMSANASTVVFIANANNLDPSDTFNTTNVFVRDRMAGTTHRISYTQQSSGGPGNLAISADGRMIVFDGYGIPVASPFGTWVHDRVSKKNRLIPFPDPLRQGYNPVLNANGRFAAMYYNYQSANYILVADLGPRSGVTVSSPQLALIEGAMAGTYSVVLDNEPTAPVTIAIAPGNQLSASASQLTFTAANWNVAQLVSVQAIQDNIVEGSHSGQLMHTVTSTDPTYQVVAPFAVNVAIIDATVPTIVLPPMSGTMWNLSLLPLRGTAAPLATVLVVATHLGGGALTAASAVADANGAWSRSLAGLADGPYELQAQADALKSNKAYLSVDTAAPTVTPVFGNNTLTLLIEDSGSGILSSEISLDGGALWIAYTGPRVFTQGGMYSVDYRVRDKAGNLATGRTSFGVAIEVTPSITTYASGMSFNRSTQQFNGTFTITNAGTAALAGPLQVRFNALPAGVVLANASGSYQGSPYITVGAGLAPGASASFPVVFTNPSRLDLAYTTKTYSGNF
ncbi:MAG: WD40-like Beta Propeller Repeat [Massilia sp.]|nr:WD40-like Beta Propeller Repeat [Massilia sp.]